MTFGDNKPAPPVISREMVELQRAASKIALSVKVKVPDEVRLTVEADIGPTLARLIFQYSHTALLKRKTQGTVEINLATGYPIDDLDWLEGLADGVSELINEGQSDLVIPRVLGYIRYVDANGNSIYEEGNTKADRLD